MSNQRFRVWDSQALNDVCKLSLQLTQKIEELATEQGEPIEDLPPSLIPSERLYVLAVAFVAAYDKLVQYDLVRTGNIQKTKNSH